MTVKEVLIKAAKLLSLDEAAAFLETGEEGTENAQANALLTCFHTVENELALDYFPRRIEETLQTQTGAIVYEELSKKAVRILFVHDEWGNELPFKTFPEYVKTQSGKITIGYCYLPEEKTLAGECDFKLFVSVRMMAYGIAAEYALQNGMFEDAAVWNKKYKDAICAAYKNFKSVKIKQRRWV